MDSKEGQSGSLEGDAALVAALKANAPGAYEQLVRRTAGMLLAVGRRFMRDEADAQDALQDAYIQVFRSLGSFEGRSSLNTWVHRIMVTSCLMRLRSRRREHEESIEGLLPRFVPNGHQAAPGRRWQASPLEEAAAGELRGQVRACIDQLPEAYRAILLLRDIEEVSTEEAATILEVSQSVVKTRLHRARQALKTLLEPLMTRG